MDRRNLVLFSLIVCLLVNVLITGCAFDLRTKSSYSYHGTFTFFKNNKEVKGPVSWILYNTISQKIETIILNFGFVRNNAMEGEWFKDKNNPGSFSDYPGSDAAISLFFINKSHFFGLALDDYTNADKTTEFTDKLIESIISTLKKEFEFSQITFKETGVSPFI